MKSFDIAGLQGSIPGLGERRRKKNSTAASRFRLCSLAVDGLKSKLKAMAGTAAYKT